MQYDIRFSRPVLAATRMGEQALDHHRFVDKRVLLTGERDTLATANGQECLLSGLRLLLRICPNVSVAIPASVDGVLEECRTLARHLAFGAPVDFVTAPPREYRQYDAILSVGTAARPGLPWTVINSNGWLARVSSGCSDLPTACSEFNPVGALAAACLGVADVFKRLIRLKERRGRLFDGLTFSLYSYSCGEVDAGPSLPRELPLDLVLVGAGAIGNGMIHLLRQLPTSGRVWIVDCQKFRDENLGTCLLIGPQELDAEKASFAAKMLEGRLQAKGFQEELEVFQNRLGSEIPYPRVVLTALDNIDARHAAQKLWPDLLIDGAIGDFPCQVSRYQWGEDSACLLCLFRLPAGRAAEDIASEATGLSHSRIQQADEVVTEKDIDAAPADRREWLRERVGHQICSVVREGVAERISQEQQRPGFAPSVPFVACLGACMMAAELVKYVSGWTTTLATRYQFDVLHGPVFGSMVPQERRRDCACVARARNIETWRSVR